MSAVPSGDEKKQPVKVTAEELAREYEENEVAADKKNGGTELRVTGTLAAVSNTDSGEPVLRLETNRKRAATVEVICFKNRSDAVAELKTGLPVAVTARGLGFYKAPGSSAKDLVRLEHGAIAK